MNEKQIPERFRERYENWATRDHYYAVRCIDAMRIVEELGTAESLIRELAQALQVLADFAEPFIIDSR